MKKLAFVFAVILISACGDNCDTYNPSNPACQQMYGYGQQPYNYGYPQTGYPQTGYPQSGYPQYGYPQTGGYPQGYYGPGCRPGAPGCGEQQ